jgi:hypothetical protein
VGSDGYKLAGRAEAAAVIRQLGHDDLLFLNRLIVERLKLLSQAHSTTLLARFGVGDRVSFQSPSGDRKTGQVVRLNKKSASIQTDDGQQWKVHPGFLTHADDRETSVSADPAILRSR